MKLSLCLIVRDSEKVLAQTLDSAKSFVDEIIVVDTGSLDGTIELAKSYGAQVETFEWIDDFAAARNYSFSFATGDWIMWLDAGDVIPPEAQEAFLRLKGEPVMLEGGEADVIICELNRVIEPETGKVIFHYAVPRIARRSANPYWRNAVHEELIVDSLKGTYFPYAWVNDPDGYGKVPTERNIRILEKMMAGGDETPRTAYYYANELRDHERHEEAIDAYKNFLAKNHFTWEYYEALLSMAKCHRSLDQLIEAAGVLFQAMYFNSTRAEAFVMLGDMFYDQGRWPNALPFYLAVIGMRQPMDGSPVLDIAYTYLPFERIAFCQMGMNNLKEAANAFHQAVKLAPPDAAAKFKEMAKKCRASSKGK